MKFGLRAHDFGRLPPASLADKLAFYKPECIQLARSKAFPEETQSQAGMAGTDSENARSIARVFAEKNISIAVLGCYINPVHPDADAREVQLRRFEEHLRLACDFGAAIVGTETGSLNPDSSFHPGTQASRVFDRLCTSIERLVRAAESYGAMVGIEPVADSHVLSTIDKTVALLERFPSPSLGILFDPVNLIPARRIPENQAFFLQQAFSAFGSRIAAVHVKDYRNVEGIKSAALPAGTGDFDLESFFRLLWKYKPSADVILENTSSETAAEALRRVIETAARVAPS